MTDPNRLPCFVVSYQPAMRFWPFQLIESGIYLVLAALLLAGTSLVVRCRRD